MDSPPPYSKVCSNPSGVGKVSSNASVGSPNFSGGSASSRTFTPILPPRLGPNPVEMDCPSCKSHILTNIATTPGALAWIICMLCFFTGWVGFFCCFLCWVPFCIEDCMDVVHTCPSCNVYLGKYSRL
uniref:LITAF domain-containing protein n=1 Tax=Meloidogyne incognita TaxID=6306 RepID=A0A914MJ88_MELIC